MLDLFAISVILLLIFGIGIFGVIICIAALLTCDWFFGTNTGRRFCRWLFTEDYY